MKNDGGPAFPNEGNDHYGAGATHSHDGMSLRDWYRGMALIGLLANRDSARMNADEIALETQIQADAMLVAREGAA